MRHVLRHVVVCETFKSREAHLEITAAPVQTRLAAHGAISLEAEALVAEEEGTTPRRKPSKPAHAPSGSSSLSTMQRRAFGLAALVAASFAILSASAALRNSPRDRELGGEAARDRELGGEAAPAPSTYVSSCRGRRHDGTRPGSAFTQGLAFDAHGRLFESDGLYHQSRVREVDPATRRSVRTATNSPSIFGEGVEVLGDTVIQITWQE